MSVGSTIGLKILNVVIGIPVGIATKKAIDRVWLVARPDDPPRKAKQEGVAWPDAVAWAALSGAGIVVRELVVLRASQSTYRAITGNEPPPPKPSKAERKAISKAEKAQRDDDDRPHRAPGGKAVLLKPATQKAGRTQARHKRSRGKQKQKQGRLLQRA